MKKENWEKEFIIEYRKKQLKLKGEPELLEIWLLDFIRRLLKSEKEKLLKKIKLKKRPEEGFEGEDSDVGYNEAIADLEKLKEEIKKELKDEK